MAMVLRTQTDSKDDKQMIPLTLDQTVLKLNDDNVLFMSNSEKIKSGYSTINPDDYPNTVAGLKLLVKDMKYESLEKQNNAFLVKLNALDSSLSEVIEKNDDSNELEDEFDEIFGN
jgi:hypothetical protein